MWFLYYQKKLFLQYFLYFTFPQTMLSNIVIFTIKFICSDCITEWGQDLQFPASYNFNNNCMGRQIMILQEHSILLWTVCQLLEKRVVHLGYGNVKKKILKVSRAWTKGHCSQILIMKRNILPSAGGTENPGTTPEGGNDLWVPCQAVHGKAEGLRNHVDWKELHDKKKKKSLSVTNERMMIFPVKLSSSWS